MENNKIVKKLTKALIFTLCCVFIMGSLYIPTYAVETPPSNIDWSDTYFVFYNQSYDDIGDGGMLTFSAVDGSYRYDMFESDIIVPHAFLPITYDDGGTSTPAGTGYFILDIVANVGDKIALTKAQYSDALYRTYDIASATDLTIDLTDFEEPFLYLYHIGDSSSNPVVFLRVKVYVNIIDNDYTDELLYQLGYQEGYNEGSHDGFDDGYTAGFLDGTEESNTNGFIQTLFRPITALHSAVIFDINGTAQGGEISIGAIFIAILGITGLTAFLKHFAGG